MFQGCSNPAYLSKFELRFWHTSSSQLARDQQSIWHSYDIMQTQANAAVAIHTTMTQ